METREAQSETLEIGMWGFPACGQVDTLAPRLEEVTRREKRSADCLFSAELAGSTRGEWKAHRAPGEATMFASMKKPAGSAAAPLNAELVRWLSERAQPALQACLLDARERLAQSFYLGIRMKVGRDSAIVDVRSDPNVAPWSGGCCASWPIAAASGSLEQCLLRAQYQHGFELGEATGLPAEASFALAFLTLPKVAREPAWEGRSAPPSVPLSAPP